MQWNISSLWTFTAIFVRYTYFCIFYRVPFVKWHKIIWTKLNFQTFEQVPHVKYGISSVDCYSLSFLYLLFAVNWRVSFERPKPQYISFKIPISLRMSPRQQEHFVLFFDLLYSITIYIARGRQLTLIRSITEPHNVYYMTATEFHAVLVNTSEKSFCCWTFFWYARL